MNRKLIITKLEEQILTAVQENDEIVELHCADNCQEDLVRLGNIYVGKVKKIVQNIGAAFVEIRKGFECYYTLNENASPIFTNKIGKKPLCVGDELLVQVSREAVKTKAPTVSSKLNFTGKFAILTLGDTRVGVSSKVGYEARERLQKIVTPYVSKEYGFIVRTNAKDASDEMICQELEQLIAEYEAIKAMSATRVCYSCLKSAPKQYLTEITNIYQEGLTDIIVEDKEIYEEVKQYLAVHQPEDLEKLRLYEDKLLPLHKLYSIEKHIENALSERVWLKSGAYLVIQPTEALTVVDVNTGKCVNKKDLEETRFKINLEAALETAKQIRLRNLSGIIIVDFINLAKQEMTDALLEAFRKELKKDPIATTLVDITKLHLVEITRKKVRKPFHETKIRNDF